MMSSPTTELESTEKKERDLKVATALFALLDYPEFQVWISELKRRKKLIERDSLTQRDEVRIRWNQGALQEIEVQLKKIEKSPETVKQIRTLQRTMKKNTRTPLYAFS